MRLALTLVSVLFITVSLGAQTPAQKRARPAPPRAAPPGLRQPASLEDDKRAIAALHDADLKANMAYDVDALAALWTEDVVVMPPNHAAIAGKEANRAFLQQGKAEMDKLEILSYDTEWQEVQITGDLAVEWGTISGRLRPNTAASETEYKHNTVRVLKRTPEGGWRIARTIWNSAEPEKAAAAPPVPAAAQPAPTPPTVKPTPPQS